MLTNNHNYINSNKDAFDSNTSSIERTLCYDDLLRTILGYLSCNELFSIKLVCQDFNRVVCVMYKDSKEIIASFKYDCQYRCRRFSNHLISNKLYFCSSLSLLKVIRPRNFHPSASSADSFVE